MSRFSVCFSIEATRYATPVIDRSRWLCYVQQSLLHVAKEADYGSIPENFETMWLIYYSEGRKSAKPLK